jgi:hypothetical protein
MSVPTAGVMGGLGLMDSRFDIRVYVHGASPDSKLKLIIELRRCEGH